jgi:hypothetical protein
MGTMLEELLAEDDQPAPSVLDVDAATLPPPPDGPRPRPRARPVGTFDADPEDPRRPLPSLLIAGLITTLAGSLLLLAGALALS